MIFIGKTKYHTHVEPNLEVIRMWRENGETINNILKKLKVGKESFYKYLKQYSELQEVMESSKEKLIAKLTKSLYKESLGYEYEEVTTEEKMTSVGLQTSRKVVTKHARPQINGLIFALYNLAPELFQKVDKDLNNIKNNEQNDKSFSDETIKNAYDLLYKIDNTKIKQEIETLENPDKKDSKNE